MDSLSRNILAVLLPFSVLFSRPSWKKALTLLLGTIICTGRRTVCSALRAMGLCNEAGFSKFHHLLNRTHWSPLRAAKILLFMLLPLVQGGLPIRPLSKLGSVDFRVLLAAIRLPFEGLYQFRYSPSKGSRIAAKIIPKSDEP
jgi:hypothetical protein